MLVSMRPCGCGGALVVVCVVEVEERVTVEVCTRSDSGPDDDKSISSEDGKNGGRLGIFVKCL